jgi:hypothetical protein
MTNCTCGVICRDCLRYGAAAFAASYELSPLVDVAKGSNGQHLKLIEPEGVFPL